MLYKSQIIRVNLTPKPSKGCRKHVEDNKGMRQADWSVCLIIELVGQSQKGLYLHGNVHIYPK